MIVKPGSKQISSPPQSEKPQSERKLKTERMKRLKPISTNEGAAAKDSWDLPMENETCNWQMGIPKAW